MSRNGLVFSGGEIKLRLEQERFHTSSPVHIDWLRFTVQLRHAPFPMEQDLFPTPESRGFSDEQYVVTHTKNGTFIRDLYEEEADRKRQWIKVLRELGDEEFTPGAQAKALADDVCGYLGADFAVSPELKKGKDFYKHRWEIQRAGQPVGWVGFCASGDKAHLNKQAQTIHCNLEGMACTFAEPGWPVRLRSYLEEHRAVVTRCDLALDFFNGIEGGIHRFPDEYEAGSMDVHGSRPAHNQVGPWRGGRGLSFYFGSKHGGKQTNIYEKGIQLYGDQDPHPWMRVELRYGSQKRFIPIDILSRPADFFAGASDWHTAILKEHGEVAAPEAIPCIPELPVQTIEAEVTRNVRWLFSSAGRSMALAIMHLDLEQLGRFVENRIDLPKRLRKFKAAEVQQCFARAFETVLANSSGRAELLPV